MKLLFVNCCISQRGTGSRTHALAEAFLTAFLASHPGLETEEVTPETTITSRSTIHRAFRAPLLMWKLDLFQASGRTLGMFHRHSTIMVLVMAPTVMVMLLMMSMSMPKAMGTKPIT